MVTEAREFQPNGAPPAFPALQDGSVSTWQIMPSGALRPINLDVASGTNNTGRTACWLDFSDENTFFVSNAIEAGLASYSFNDGQIELLDQVAAQGIGATGNTTDPAAAFGTTEGWIDMWISDDGQFLYQLFGLTGSIGVYEINGTTLTFVEVIEGDLPTNNTQGIVAVGQPGTTPGSATPDGNPTAGAGCEAPSDIEVSSSSPYIFLVEWNDVPGADEYVIEARLQGSTSFPIRATVRSNYAKFFIPFETNIEYRISTVCADGSTSAFSAIQSISTGRGLASNDASSRSSDRSAIDVDLSNLVDLTTTEFAASPNPFDREINVIYTATTDDAQLNIYHVSGARVYKQTLSKDTPSHRIQTGDLENGLYILTVEEQGQAPRTLQLVKQN